MLIGSRVPRFVENPKDENSHQSLLRYLLTDQDILELYGYMTPREIRERFGSHRCRSEASMYLLIRKYKLDRPLAAKKYLGARVLNDIPDDYSLPEWEKIAPELIEMAKSEASVRVFMRIKKHEDAWDV
jgi:hypothetical protein